MGTTALVANAGPGPRRARGPAEEALARSLPRSGEYVETVVEEDATDRASESAGNAGSAGSGAAALESLVVEVIASDEDGSDDHGGVNPV